ncbi:MAG: APC family permease, partial [Candidatus Limnocylindrales bacterium]
MIGGRRSLQGRKPGDRRVRVERPHAPYFRYTGRGQLTARQAASAPTTPAGKAWALIRGFFVGRPLMSDDELGERLSKKKALAIFSSDAISSSAYATEEILRVLILGGATAMAFGLEISIAIAVLLIAVALSYRQICIAYPTGGGSYSVSKRNIGRTVSLVAASALLIDYVMTVAVSTTSAVEQVTSAFPGLFDERVLIGIGVLALITLGNLRGLREAGNIFAVPTYLFIGSALLMIAVGVFRIFVLGEGSSYAPQLSDQVSGTIQPLTAILVLRAFAAGAVALTGTEAIATGVPAFKPPESRNAAFTLGVMAALLGVLFIGITLLAVRFGISPIEVPKQTVISQIARNVYGDGVLFYLFQGFTAVLLFLAANTSFNAFPRLLAILAIDGHMP